MAFEMPNPFRKEAPRKPPPPGISNADWAKMYIMAFVLFLVVGTMIYLKKSLDQPPKGDEKPGADQVGYKMRDSGVEGTGAAVKQGAPRKEIPIPPLPPEGAVSFRDLAAPFQDGEEKPVKESLEFVNLLNVFLNRVTPESIRKAVQPELTADKAFLEPSKHRGEALRSYGHLIQIFTESMETTTPNNIRYVYLGIMQEYLTNRTVYFYLPELPRNPATGKPMGFNVYYKGGEQFIKDWVEIEGVFLRQYVYPSQLKDRNDRDIYAKSAVVFAKTIRVVPEPKYSDSRGSFIIIVIIMAGVAVTIVIVAGVMSRRYGSGTLREKMAAIKKEACEKAASGNDPSKPAPPPPSPPA